MDVGIVNGVGKNRVRKQQHHEKTKTPKDPELEAEISYAKENGYEPPKSLPSDKKLAELVDIDDGPDQLKHLLKNLKNGRSERKARSRGISGCSTKKDGNRFEYGLECIDLDNDVIVSDADSTDDEMNEYSDYVVKYSECEIRQIVGEYLLNGNLDESLVESMRKFCFNIDTSTRLTKDLVILSIEHTPEGGIELGIKLIAELLRREFITQGILIEVFEELAESLEDLMKDSPKINESLAIFMAKLVKHAVWDNMTIKLLAGKNVGNGDLVEKCYANALAFTNNHYLLQVGCPPVGPCESTETLSMQFKLILNGYLESGDKETESKRLAELKVPNFNHEFVYQTGIMAMEKMNDNIMENLAQLLKYMTDNEIIAKNCVIKGFDRLFDALYDLQLDLPAAYILASRWIDKSLKADFITKEIADKCPKLPRARARTLSQGPDGKLSCTDSEPEEISGESNESDAAFNGH